MKRTTAFLLSLCACASIATAFTGCGHEHTYESVWTKDATHHWHACEGDDCSEISGKAEHVWNDGEITTPATKDAQGVKTFTCTTCNQTKTEATEYEPKTTVTAEEWATAFNLGTNWTITATATHPVYQQLMTIIQQRDGNKFYCIEKMSDMSGNIIDKYEDYDEIVDNVWYGYRYDSDAQKFEKVTISDPVEVRLASMLSDYLPSCIYVPTAFTYDETTKAYVAASILNTQTNTELKNMSLCFEDGKLVSFSYSIVMGEATVPYNMTFTYGNTSVTLPVLE